MILIISEYGPELRRASFYKESLSLLNFLRSVYTPQGRTMRIYATCWVNTHTLRGKDSTVRIVYSLGRVLYLI